MNKIENIGTEILHGIAYPFEHTAQFCAVLGTALKDEPAVKTALIGLIKAAESVIADGTADVASKGLNIAGDIQTVTDVQSFFKYFASSFLPVIESAYKDIKADTAPAAEINAIPS